MTYNTRYKMKQDTKGRELFRHIIDETPKDLKKQLGYSDAIAIKLDGMLKMRDMSQRDLAKNNGLPHGLSKWVILKVGSAFVPKANAPLHSAPHPEYQPT